MKIARTILLLSCLGHPLFLQAEEKKPRTLALYSYEAVVDIFNAAVNSQGVPSGSASIPLRKPIDANVLDSALNNPSKASPVFLSGLEKRMALHQVFLNRSGVILPRVGGTFYTTLQAYRQISILERYLGQWMVYQVVKRPEQRCSLLTDLEALDGIMFPTVISKGETIRLSSMQEIPLDELNLWSNLLQLSSIHQPNISNAVLNDKSRYCQDKAAGKSRSQQEQDIANKLQLSLTTRIAQEIGNAKTSIEGTPASSGQSLMGSLRANQEKSGEAVNLDKFIKIIEEVRSLAAEWKMVSQDGLNLRSLVEELNKIKPDELKDSQKTIASIQEVQKSQRLLAEYRKEIGSMLLTLEDISKLFRVEHDGRKAEDACKSLNLSFSESKTGQTTVDFQVKYAACMTAVSNSYQKLVEQQSSAKNDAVVNALSMHLLQLSNTLMNNFPTPAR